MHLIIINFYGTYILRNLRSEVQQNTIIKYNRQHGRPKVLIRMRDNRRFMVEMQFGINLSLSFFRKIVIVSDVFKVMWSSFQTLSATTEKAYLPKLSFVLCTISCTIEILWRIPITQFINEYRKKSKFIHTPIIIMLS